MALVIAHTVPIGTPEDARHGRLDRDRIWTVMQQKAADPLEFVPMITESRVVEQYEDGFLRDVVFFGRDHVLERIRPRADKNRILFEVIDHPRLELIYNELDVDSSGGFTYTLSTRFTEGFVAGVKEDFDALGRTSDLLRETAEASARTIGEKARTLAATA
ncbi:AtaL-like protein [Rhodococcus sp. NPDC003318]|uniref:AtaL-like protein n=1 Tax=Rhodococcus sp. NPDC003318 TaxID=3364503 RepID=UPI003680C004